MSRERLAQLMQARRAAMDVDPAHETTQEAILSVFSALEKGDVTKGQAVRVLGYQATRAWPTSQPMPPSIARQPQTSA